MSGDFFQRNRSFIFFAICCAIFLVAVWVAITPGDERAAEEDPDDPANAGAIVVEKYEVENYTYLKLATGINQTVWVASPPIDANKGDRVIVQGAAAMQDFYSSTLDRTFPEILFVEAAAVIDAQGQIIAHSKMPGSTPGHGAMAAGSGDNLPEVTAVDPPPGGIAIARLNQEFAALDAQRISIRGTIVKASPGILGTNWFHLRDGSAPGMECDVIVTSNEMFDLGELATVRGTVEVNREKEANMMHEYVVRAESVTLEARESATAEDSATENSATGADAAEQSTGETQAAPRQIPQLLTEQEIAEGWVSLFDGESFFGWTKTSDANWEIADGVITVSEGDPGFLRTNSQFGDFELKLEFKSALGTNSGVFLRTPETPADPATDCYELNIADVGVSPFTTGGFVGRQPAAGDEAAQRARDKNEWQSFHVVARGGTFTVDLDGERVLEYSDPEPLGRGHILLQLNSGDVAFREIKLKPLGLEDLMTEENFPTQWREYPDQPATFEFADGELRILGGPGQLETTQAYADFVMQSEVKVNKPELNSGIFFRNIPESLIQGYEAQIHNGIKNGDPTQPVDAGTGAIFRRQAARVVVSQDLEWFTQTIIAAGDHMAVWVNGFPVTDWIDDRPEHENPRQGKRLAAGTFALQAHDPTTDVSFRRFRAGELPERQ